MLIVISSGHGKYVAGAVGPSPWGLTEVTEARRVVEEVANWLTVNGHEVETIHDDVSHDQKSNLNWLVSQHNKFPSEDRADISIHFNAYIPDPEAGRGVETLWVSEKSQEVAKKVAAAIAQATGLINRGDKQRSDLYWLNGTTGSLGAILIECCFVDAGSDCELYRASFEEMCRAIADVAPAPEKFDANILRVKGKVSWFGGEDDLGVDADEPLAFIYDVSTKPSIFLPESPPGTTGLARRLDSDGANYFAVRFDYEQFSKEFLAGPVMARITAPKTGKSCLATPADWGPHVDTSRACDVSRKVLFEELGIDTDDEIELVFPI